MSLPVAIPHDVFVSYKREEVAHARALAQALQAAGWTVWWDVVLRGGERFDRVIEAAIRSSACVLVLWSKRSVVSDYILDEANLALDVGKLVPARLEQVQVPFRFARIHTRDLSSWDLSASHPSLAPLLADISRYVQPRPASALPVGDLKTQPPASAPAAPPRAERSIPARTEPPVAVGEPIALPGSKSLASRCPACETIFRVVPDQLSVQQGWVRCGRCKNVFNASENLVDVPAGSTTMSLLEHKQK
jgi:predicted Zn finger-like uncharacterized protein